MRMLDRYERGLIGLLSLLLAATIGLAALELCWILILDLVSPPWGLLDSRELLELFGLFLLVLLGLELLHSLRHVEQGSEAHLEIMFAVALIAVARKVLVLEPDKLAPGTLIGLAALVAALAVGYALVHHAHGRIDPRTGEDAGKERGHRSSPTDR